MENDVVKWRLVFLRVGDLRAVFAGQIREKRLASQWEVKYRSFQDQIIWRRGSNISIHDLCLELYSFDDGREKEAIDDIRALRAKEKRKIEKEQHVHEDELRKQVLEALEDDWNRYIVDPWKSLTG